MVAKSERKKNNRLADERKKRESRIKFVASTSAVEVRRQLDCL